MTEMLRFISRQVSLRCKACVMQSLEYKHNYAHVFKEDTGLAVVAITDEDYPSRAAHGVVRTTMRQFHKDITAETWGSAADDSIVWPYLKTLLTQFMSPAPDKITLIQDEIDKSKEIVMASIDKVLDNMDQLDELVAKSEDLSSSSRMFYKKTKKMNRCCIIL